MSWKPVVQVAGEGDKWHKNGLTFETYTEALDNARDLFVRWTLTTAYSAVESDEPVNYRWSIERGLEAVHNADAEIKLS